MARRLSWSSSWSLADPVGCYSWGQVRAREMNSTELRLQRPAELDICKKKAGTGLTVPTVNRSFWAEWHVATGCQQRPHPLAGKGAEVRKKSTWSTAAFSFRGKKKLGTPAAWAEMAFWEARGPDWERGGGREGAVRCQAHVRRAHTGKHEHQSCLSSSRTRTAQEQVLRQGHCVRTEGPLYTFLVKSSF